jgi:hypothetical protein
MQLHGPAKSLQIAKMSFENKSLGMLTAEMWHQVRPHQLQNL